MLGKIASIRDSVSQNVKELAKDAMSEAKDALREGQALARAAAKSREQTSDLSSWDVGGFSVAATGEADNAFGKADAEEALNEASVVQEMLEQLKKSANAPEVAEKERIEKDEKTEELQDLEFQYEEEEKSEDIVKKVGKRQNKKVTSAKKKALKAEETPVTSTSPVAASATPAAAVTALVPLLEARLQALQAKVASMEDSREDLAASKAKFEEELRETRISIELVTAEKQKMASQLEEQKKKLAAAEKLSSEKDAALKAEKVRVAELAAKVVESKRASSKEQEDVAVTWKAKISTLTTEMEKLKSELETAIQAASEAKNAQELAESARFEAEQKESAAEQRAIAAMNEATQLRAARSHASDQAEQLIRDNERRSKTFNAAVEAQVQRFKAGLEEERDTALNRVEEAQKANLNLQERLAEVTAALHIAKESAEEHAAAVLVEKSRVEEYERVVATMQGQVAAAVKASETAETQLKVAQMKWDEESASLKNKLKTLEEELKIAIDKAQKAEMSVATVLAEAEQWRTAAQRVEKAQAAEATAKKDVDAAIAETTALKIQIAQLQREMAENSVKDTGTFPRISSSSGVAEGGLSDFNNSAPPRPSAPGTTCKNKNDNSGLSGSRFRRESSSNVLSGFDLESLRWTPLLAGQRPAGGLLETQQQRRSTLSPKHFVWMYMALVHVLLLVAMGRASHAHLACEHMHLGAGGLP